MSDLTTERPAELQVFVWLVEGNREEDIREAIAEEYPDQKKQAAKLIKGARAKIEELAESAPDQPWCLAALREIYRRALASGELGVAIRAVDKIQKYRPPIEEF